MQNTAHPALVEEPIATEVAAPADESAALRGMFHGLRWTHRAVFRPLLEAVDAQVWSDPSRAGGRHVKGNAARDVWRISIQGRDLFLKYFAAHTLRDRIKQSAGLLGCHSEWRCGSYLLAAGVSAVRPLGFAEGVSHAGRRCALLVTEAITPATPLSRHWELLQSDDDASRRRRDVAHLTQVLGELVARAHQSGFEHLDLHPDNILIQAVAPRRYRAHFVDLQSARSGRPVLEHAVVRNLAQLNQWFRRHSSVGDRLRFLRAYYRWRLEYETLSPHACALSTDFRGLVRALDAAAQRHARRLWNARDRRAQRDGRYFAQLRLQDGWRGVAYLCTKRAAAHSPASTRTFSGAWWRQQFQKPLEWLTPARIVKDSHTAVVARADLPHAEGPIPVILKRPRARGLLRTLRQIFAGSRTRRAWRIGNALLNRDLPAARPLALLEQTRFGVPVDSLLVTEFVGNSLDLRAYLLRDAGLPPRERRRRVLSLSAALVTHLRRFFERGFVHRDCKAENLLISDSLPPRLVWVDMDGIRQRPAQRGDVVRALARLVVSLDGAPLTRCDFLRVLRGYTARFGAPPEEWRGWWREIAAAAERKRAQKSERRRWKLTHYGRE